MFCFLDDRDSGMFDPFLLLLFVTASDRLIMIGGNAVGGGGTNVATWTGSGDILFEGEGLGRFW